MAKQHLEPVPRASQINRRQFLQLSGEALFKPFLPIAVAWNSEAKTMDWAKAPAVRPPTALCGEAGDNRAYLEWNPNLEGRLSGYHVYRAEQGQGFHRITSKPWSEPSFLDETVENSRTYVYKITAVLGSGEESEGSNMVHVVPQRKQAPAISETSLQIQVDGYQPLSLPHAIEVRFANGHTVVFDKDLARVRDWHTPDGTHLLYPLPYGNPIEITQMDSFGFPQPQPATEQTPYLPPRINLDYGNRVQLRAPWWVEHTVQDDRVTFHYRIPLTGPELPPDATWDLWIWADIWETWYPQERNLFGTLYSGLARKIEIDIPSYYDKGFSVCLNDGFGVNGSCDSALTYELRWGNPYLLETRWQKGKNQQGIGTPRATSGFHPTMAALQVLPFLFIHFPQGTLLISPKRYYYATTYCLTNYAAQGKDGLWPNFTIDCAHTKGRFSVETFEYLWTPDNSLHPPQKFIDASFFYRRRLASLYQLNPYLTCMDYAWDYWGPPPEQVRNLLESQALKILKQWGKEMAQKAQQMGADQLGGAHELWTSSPYTVPNTIRLDPEHPINRAIAEMVQELRQRGVRFGYWMRPEFVKTPIPNILSDHFVTPYYGYVAQVYPPALPILARDGLKLIRSHPEWIRKGRDGSYPTNTPYHWTPMSLASGWYREVVFMDLAMMRRLGYSSVLLDGGFSCLAGVDYTQQETVPVQPYLWRLYQDVYRLGLDVNGECMLGWGNNNLPLPIPEDMNFLWAYVHSMYPANRAPDPLKWFTPDMRHRSHQLYIACQMNLDSAPGHAKVARFAQEFVKTHGHPDRVFLEGLRLDGERWIWGNVWWEYANGKRVRYPNYTEIAT